MSGLCYLPRDTFIRVFLTDAASLANILLTTSFLFSVFYVLSTALVTVLYLWTSRRMMREKI